MVKFNIFVMRAILGAVFAVVLSRIFRPEYQIPYVVLFAVILVGLAYVLEYWRERKFKDKQ
ncbi:MAG: hypothetical protein V2I97_06205 [Desulfococcaceae bacterium]|nr:hypothetical protein [Desulfococcaceae bacterium]